MSNRRTLLARLPIAIVISIFSAACAHEAPRPYSEVNLIPGILDKQKRIAFVAVSNVGYLGPKIPQLERTIEDAISISATVQLWRRPSLKTEREDTSKAIIHSLEDDGFTVVADRTNLDGLVADYLDLLSWHGDEVRYDFSALAKRTRADLIFCIEYMRPRLMQSMVGPKTVGYPRGVTAVIGALINPHSKTFPWQHLEIAEEPVVGEWDEPPDYPKLEKAMLKSLEKASNQTFFKLF